MGRGAERRRPTARSRPARASRTVPSRHDVIPQPSHHPRALAPADAVGNRSRLPDRPAMTGRIEVAAIHPTQGRPGVACSRHRGQPEGGGWWSRSVSSGSTSRSSPGTAGPASAVAEDWLEVPPAVDAQNVEDYVLGRFGEPVDVAVGLHRLVRRDRDGLGVPRGDARAARPAVGGAGDDGGAVRAVPRRQPTRAVRVHRRSCTPSSPRWSRRSIPDGPPWGDVPPIEIRDRLEHERLRAVQRRTVSTSSCSSAVGCVACCRRVDLPHRRARRDRPVRAVPDPRRVVAAR